MSPSSGRLTATSSTLTDAPAAERVSPLRQRFIQHLILQQKAPRTVQAYTAWVRDLAPFHHRSPDRLGPPEIRVWVLHLITERKLSASSVPSSGGARLRRAVRVPANGGLVTPPANGSAKRRPTIRDMDAARLPLRLSHPKGGRQRVRLVVQDSSCPRRWHYPPGTA